MKRFWEARNSVLSLILACLYFPHIILFWYTTVLWCVCVIKYRWCCVITYQSSPVYPDTGRGVSRYLCVCLHHLCFPSLSSNNIRVVTWDFTRLILIVIVSWLCVLTSIHTTELEFTSLSQFDPNKLRLQWVLDKLATVPRNAPKYWIINPRKNYWF